MASPPHILLFPFMAKGHTTPLLHLARLIRRRGLATVTFVTTPKNRSFISSCLSGTDDDNVCIVDIPFPQHAEGIPSGIESTDKLPDISLMVELAVATNLMKDDFERALESLPRVSFMITDSFLPWTQDSAAKYGIPRLSFSPTGTIPIILSRLVARGRYDELEDEEIKLHDFPLVKLKKWDIPPIFMDPEERTKETIMERQFVDEQRRQNRESYGVVVNTFYEIESQFVDFWVSKFGIQAWCLGPMCSSDRVKVGQANDRTPWWISWLDQMKAEGKPVLYVAFGTQVEISAAQIREIQSGLEQSGVNFLWLVGKNESGLELGFIERVRNRGIVVREWVDQKEILEHESVQGYLCHCGWSSLMESVRAKVPILAWPMMWEQPLNAKAVEMAGVALRVDESSDGWVTSEALAKGVMELMEGEAGKEMRKKAAEVGSAAVKAVEEGGSSWETLGRLINEIASAGRQHPTGRLT